MPVRCFCKRICAMPRHAESMTHPHDTNAGACGSFVCRGCAPGHMHAPSCMHCVCSHCSRMVVRSLTPTVTRALGPTAMLQSDGKCPDGRFLVRPTAPNEAGPCHILSVVFKVSCMLPCTTSKLEALHAALQPCSFPPARPMRPLCAHSHSTRAHFCARCPFLCSISFLLIGQTHAPQDGKE
jgi:hypothetical protein